MTEDTAAEWLWHTELEGLRGLGGLVGFTVRSADDKRVGTVLHTVDELEAGLLVVNTGPWIFGRLLAVPAGLVAGIDRDAGTLRVARDRNQLRQAPAYRADTQDAFTGYRTQATSYFATQGEADRLTG
jgi:hypothetical protein